MSHYIILDLKPSGIFRAHCRSVGVSDATAAEINSPQGTSMSELQVAREKMIRAVNLLRAMDIQGNC